MCIFLLARGNRHIILIHSYIRLRFFNRVSLEKPRYIRSWRMMELARSLELPRGYRSALSGINTEKAIKLIKNHFENALSQTLNLTEVSAPLLLDEGTGLNDNLNGIEKIVSFDAKDVDRG